MLKETCNVEGWPMAPSRAVHIISIPFHIKKNLQRTYNMKGGRMREKET